MPSNAAADVRPPCPPPVRLRWWTAIMLVLACSLSPARAAEDPLLRLVDGKTFDQFVDATLRSYGVPGAVVVVANAHGAVFLKGYGVRRHGAPDPVDANTRFQIASMSKLIAATAIGVLVDRGVVSWDRPARDYAPDLALSVPYATENASLRDFLAHRTGLPDYGGDLLTKLALDAGDVVRRARYLSFGHSFRAQWAYSNLGIFLGQAAASQAAGTTPPALIRDNILQPLGMTRSGTARAVLGEDTNHADPHDIDLSLLEPDDVDAFGGAGAIVSTGADLAHWMAMLLGKGTFGGRQILSEKTVSDIFAASMVQGIGGPLRDPNDAAGLGCETYQFLGVRVVEKNGALDGMRTIVTLIPQREIGIAILANKQLTVFPEAVRAAFLEREIGPSGRDLQAQIRAEQPLWEALAAAPAPPPDAEPAVHDPGALVGRYDSRLYGAMVVAREGSGLVVRVGANGYGGTLSHWSADTYLVSFADKDVLKGLLTFRFAGTDPVGIDGTDAPGLPGGALGRFAFVSR